jgi:hypothetical protein
MPTQDDGSRAPAPFQSFGFARALYAAGDRLYWSRGAELFVSRADGSQARQIGVSPEPGWVRAASSSKLGLRLLRAGFHDLVELPSGDLIAIVRQAIVRKPAQDPCFSIAHRVTRGSRPLNLCLTPEGRLYFGEYFRNPDRAAVHVYGSEDGGKSWEVAYTFAAGTVRHVHQVAWDPFRQGVWVFTGDEDSECQMLFTADRFRTLEKRFAGRQYFRTVACLFTTEGLLYGTDSPFEENAVQLLELKSGKLRRLQPLPSSSFSATQAGGHFVFSTAADPSLVNDTRACTLWCSRDLENWRRLARWERDRLPAFFFQYPNITLAAGDPSRTFLYSSSVALQGRDQEMQIWRLAP